MGLVQVVAHWESPVEAAEADGPGLASQPVLRALDLCLDALLTARYIHRSCILRGRPYPSFSMVIISVAMFA